MPSESLEPRVKSLNYLNNVLAKMEAARAGCRLYAVPHEQSEEDATAMIGNVLAEANLDGYSVEFDPHPSSAIEHLMQGGQL